MLLGSAKELKLVDSFQLALCCLFCRGEQHLPVSNRAVIHQSDPVSDVSVWRAVSLNDRAGIPSGPWALLTSRLYTVRRKHQLPKM